MLLKRNLQKREYFLIFIHINVILYISKTPQSVGKKPTQTTLNLCPLLIPVQEGGFFLRCAFLPPEIKAIDRLINKYQTLSPNLHIEEPDPFYGERG